MVEKNTASFLGDSHKETLIMSLQEANTQAQLGTTPLWQQGLIKEWTVLYMPEESGNKKYMKRDTLGQVEHWESKLVHGIILILKDLTSVCLGRPVKFCCVATTAPDNGGIWHLYHLATDNNTNSRLRVTKSPPCLEMGIRYTCLGWTTALKLPAYTGKRKMPVFQTLHGKGWYWPFFF